MLTICQEDLMAQSLDHNSLIYHLIPCSCSLQPASKAHTAAAKASSGGSGRPWARHHRVRRQRTQSSRHFSRIFEIFCMCTVEDFLLPYIYTVICNVRI